MTLLPPVLLCALAAAAAARAAPEDCSLSKERGSCGQFAVRYYYDTEYGGCLRFWYGGCDGNDNRFATEAECERACVSPPGDGLCRLPSVRGACKRAKARWYSDPTTGSCRQFTYSGCLGNDNRFESESACQQRCGRVSPSGGASATTAPPGPADCLLPDRAAGECSQYVIRYSYIAARQQCAPFYYGGCGGNANRFDSTEACQAACAKQPTTRPPYYQTPRDWPGSASGRQPPSVWRGVASRLDYYGREERPSYDREDRPQPVPTPRQPQPEDPDTSEPAADTCSLPAVPGRCRAYIYRYYFNAALGRCEKFVYGGCDGNDNRFATAAECEERCGGERQPPHGTEDRPPYGTDGRPLYGREDQTPFGRREDRPEPVAVPRPPNQPGTEAPYVSYQPETEASYATYEPESRTPAQPQPEQEPEPYTSEAPVVLAADVCSLPSDGGRCRGFMPSYYFRTGLGRCVQFIYGGCGGNKNRFSTLAECEKRCGEAGRPEAQPSEPPAETEAPDAYIPLQTAAALDACQQPPTKGSCDQRLTRYYFNAPLGSCFTFTYGGCGGNDNRFETVAECRERCRPGELQPTLAPFPPIDHGFDGGVAQTAAETTTVAEEDYPTYDYGGQDYDQLTGADSIDTSAPVPSDYYDEYYAEYEYQ